MSDQLNNSSTPAEKESLNEESLKAESRRKFTKTGLIGGAVLMSLGGRSALAGGKNKNNEWNNNCSVDTILSVYNGGSQYDFDISKCQFGCTPGFWQGGAAAKSWEQIYQLSINAGLPGAPWKPDRLFKDVFTTPHDGTTCGEDVSAELAKYTLLDYVSTPNSPTADLKQAARNSVAGMLNSLIMGVYYSAGVTPAGIIENFCLAWKAYYDSGKTDSSLLADLHEELTYLNEQQSACPLDNSDTNPFCGDGGSHRSNIGLY